MTATTNCCNVEIVLAMWVSSTDAQVDPEALARVLDVLERR